MVRKVATGTRAATSAEMRQPIQARAQATIDRVCAVALSLLTEEGWDAFNTNAIAARAGVSGPTVYRYYPNKYVLAAELRRRAEDAETEAALPTIERLGGSLPLPEAIEAWVHTTAAARARQPSALLLRSMATSVPDLAQDDTEVDRIVAALAAALRRVQSGLTPSEAQTRARALRTSVDSLIDNAIRSGRLDDDQLGIACEMAAALFRTASTEPTKSGSGQVR